MVLAAESAFVAAAIQRAIVVVAVVSAVHRTAAVRATLAFVIAGATERECGLGGSALSAHERDKGRNGASQPAHRLAPRTLAADCARQAVKTLLVHGHPPVCSDATSRKPSSMRPSN